MRQPRRAQNLHWAYDVVLLSLRACGVALRSGVVYRVRPAKGISQIFSDLQRRMLGSTSLCGAIAQLGERLHGMQEVGGSIPPGSTIESAGYSAYGLRPHRLEAQDIALSRR